MNEIEKKILGYGKEYLLVVIRCLHILSHVTQQKTHMDLLISINYLFKIYKRKKNSEKENLSSKFSFCVSFVFFSSCVQQNSNLSPGSPHKYYTLYAIMFPCLRVPPPFKKHKKILFKIAFAFHF